MHQALLKHALSHIKLVVCLANHSTLTSSNTCCSIFFALHCRSSSLHVVSLQKGQKRLPQGTFPPASSTKHTHSTLALSRARCCRSSAHHCCSLYLHIKLIRTCSSCMMPAGKPTHVHHSGIVQSTLRWILNPPSWLLITACSTRQGCAWKTRTEQHFRDVDEGLLMRLHNQRPGLGCFEPDACKFLMLSVEYE